MAELAYSINTRAELEQAWGLISGLVIDRPHEITLKPKGRPRTLSQNAVFHMWMSELSRYLIRNGRPFASAEWCKDAMKHSFLGYQITERVNVLTGEVTETRELRKTRELSTGAMFYFMGQVESWARDIGCLLTIPDNSEYMRIKREQNQ